MTVAPSQPKLAIEARDLALRFGSFVALNGVSLELPQGVRHAVIGPNGAGKTTLVNVLTGALRPSAGSVLLADRDVTALEQHKRARAGLCRTFQITQLFRGLSVLENVLIPILARTGLSRNFWRGLRGFDAQIDEAHDLLRMLKLDDVARTTPASLP